MTRSKEVMVNVTLGVFVEPSEARIVLLDADPPNAAVDQSEIDLSAAPDDTLVTTLLATARALADSGHRLVGTSLCASDTDRIYPLRDALIAAGLSGVAVVPEADAVTAAVRALSGDEPVATLVNDGRTVALSMMEAGGVTTPIAAEPIDGDPESAYRSLLQRFAAAPGAATGLIVMGSLGDDGLPADVVDTSPVPLRYPDDSEFILARGAALASFSQDATTAGPVLGAGAVAADEPPTAATPMDHADTMQGQKLAYSEVAEEDPAAYLSGPADYESFDEDQDVALDEEAEDAVRRRQWLIGSSVGALAAVGFATLAVSVAITVQPTTSQQAIRLQESPVAGKSFPVAPGQGVEPDGPNWTMIEHLPPPDAPLPEVRTFETRALSSTRDVANAAAPAIVNVYRDGTVGVQNAVAPLLPVGPAPSAPVAIPGVSPALPGLPDYVTRLIPDFSRIKPVDLLYFIANLRELIPVSVTTPSPTDGFGFSDIGVLATVPKSQGALFSADNGAAGPSVIPPALFDPQTPVTDKQQILPPGATVIDEPEVDSETPADALDLDTEPTDPATSPSDPSEPGGESDSTPDDSDGGESESISDEEPTTETTAPGTETPDPTSPTRTTTPSTAETQTPTPTGQSPTQTTAPETSAAPQPEATDTPAPRTTVAPTQTQAPPVTQAPPTTQAPQAPATQEPPETQAPPATQEPPARQAPATQAPSATQEPQTVAPRTEAPVTTLPVSPGGSYGD